MATLMLVARSIAARLSGLGVLATSAKLGEAATTSTPCCEELLLVLNSTEAIRQSNPQAVYQLCVVMMFRLRVGTKHVFEFLASRSVLGIRTSVGAVVELPLAVWTGIASAWMGETTTVYKPAGCTPTVYTWIVLAANFVRYHRFLLESMLLSDY